MVTRYDQHANLVEKAWFGADGKLVVHPTENYAMLRSRYDELGRLIEQTYFGADGGPLATEGSFYRRVVQYAGAANGFDQTYYRADNKLFQSTNGFAMSRTERTFYDAVGHLVAHCPAAATDFGEARSACLDATGDPVARRVVVTAIDKCWPGQSRWAFRQVTSSGIARRARHTINVTGQGPRRPVERPVACDWWSAAAVTGTWNSRCGQVGSVFS